jgi:hypothetical protein
MISRAFTGYFHLMKMVAGGHQPVFRSKLRWFILSFVEWREFLYSGLYLLSVWFKDFFSWAASEKLSACCISTT